MTQSNLAPTDLPESTGSCFAAIVPIFAQRADADGLTIAKQWLGDEYRETDVETAWCALAAMAGTVSGLEAAAVEPVVPIGCIVETGQPRGGIASATVRFDLDRLRDLGTKGPSLVLSCLSSEIGHAISARRPDAGDRTAFGEHRRRRAADEFVACALSLLRALPGISEEANSLVWHVQSADPSSVASRAAWLSLQGPAGLARSIELALPDHLLPSTTYPKRKHEPIDRSGFCYLIDPEALFEISGARAWGLATPEGAFITGNRVEAMEIVGGRPVLPGDPTWSLSTAEENELVRRIADRAIEHIGILPPEGFSVRQVSAVHRVETRIEHGGLDVSLPEALVERCGWMLGDRIEIAFDATGSALALFRTPNGSAVLVEADGGRVTVDRTLHNISAKWAATGTEWRRRRCEIVDGAVVLRDLPSGLPVQAP